MLTIWHSSFLARGVPSHDILPYVPSANTVDDAVFSKRVLDILDVRSVCVVTSDYHMGRAQLIFEHFFDPKYLIMVGTPNGVPAEDLRRREAHEAEAIAQITGQGGVLYEGHMYMSEGDGESANHRMQRTADARNVRRGNSDEALRTRCASV